jgi:hypothetical protein
MITLVFDKINFMRKLQKKYMDKTVIYDDTENKFIFYVLTVSEMRQVIGDQICSYSIIYPDIICIDQIYMIATEHNLNIIEN